MQIIPNEQEKLTQISSNLDAHVKQNLLTCLICNNAIFTWRVQDLVGISSKLMKHHLNISLGTCSVKQKKTHFGSEKDKLIREEVQKLLQVGHIQEVQFSIWLSNMVLVPKAIG